MTNLNPAGKPRLREKLITQGAQYLSDIELLAAFISSGNKQRSCLHLAQDILNTFGNMRTLLNSDFDAVKEVSGFGPTRYVQLQAIREMCRRSDLISLQNTLQIANSEQTFTFLKRQLRDQKNEIFVGLFLDNHHRVIAYEELFRGTIHTATIHARPIVTRGLKLNAASLILAHNHPSGHCEPSAKDLEVTNYLTQALALVDIQLLDHVVVGDNEAYSIKSQRTYFCR